MFFFSKRAVEIFADLRSIGSFDFVMVGVFANEIGIRNRKKNKFFSFTEKEIYVIFSFLPSCNLITTQLYWIEIDHWTNQNTPVTILILLYIPILLYAYILQSALLFLKLHAKLLSYFEKPLSVVSVKVNYANFILSLYICMYICFTKYVELLIH